MLKLNAIQTVVLMVFVLGAALMTFMIVVESEPGALPLFIVAVGAFGFLFTWIKSRNFENKIQGQEIGNSSEWQFLKQKQHIQPVSAPRS